MIMKTREGIYFGNREIVERYVGDKLVWQKEKEVLLFNGKARINTYLGNKELILFFPNNETSTHNELSKYMVKINGDSLLRLKNSYMLLNNKKYKHVTIGVENPMYNISGGWLLHVKFSSQIEYDEVVKQFSAMKKLPVNIISVVKK